MSSSTLPGSASWTIPQSPIYLSDAGTKPQSPTYLSDAATPREGEADSDDDQTPDPIPLDFGVHDDQETVACLIEKVENSRGLPAARLALVTMLLVVTCVIGYFSYALIDASERAAFALALDNGGRQLSNVLVAGANRQKAQGVMLSSILSSYANGSMPFTTLPGFEQIAATMMLSSDLGGVAARAVSWNPIIDMTIPGRRARFEVYVNSSAVASSLSSAVRAPGCLCSSGVCSYTGASCSSGCAWGVNQGIYSKLNGCNVAAGSDGSSRYPSRLVPVWQIAPIAQNSKAIMYNLHSEVVRQTALDNLFASGLPQFTGLINLVQDSAQRPSTIIFVPVWQSLAAAEAAALASSSSSTVDVGALAGTVSVVFSWDTLFANAVDEVSSLLSFSLHFSFFLSVFPLSSLSMYPQAHLAIHTPPITHSIIYYPNPHTPHTHYTHPPPQHRTSSSSSPPPAQPTAAPPSPPRPTHTFSPRTPTP